MKQLYIPIAAGFALIYFLNKYQDTQKKEETGTVDEIYEGTFAQEAPPMPPSKTKKSTYQKDKEEIKKYIPDYE